MVLELLPGTHETLGFIPSMTIIKKIPTKDEPSMLVYSCNTSI